MHSSHRVQVFLLQSINSSFCTRCSGFGAKFNPELQRESSTNSHLTVFTDKIIICSAMFIFAQGCNILYAGIRSPKNLFFKWSQTLSRLLLVSRHHIDAFPLIGRADSMQPILLTIDFLMCVFAWLWCCSNVKGESICTTLQRGLLIRIFHLTRLWSEYNGVNMRQSCTWIRELSLLSAVQHQV